MRVAAAEYYHQVPRLALASAREAATRALEIDSTVSEAQTALADVERMLDMDWKAAEAGYSRALTLNPSNEAALRAFGLTLALQARHVEGMAQIEQARDLDPLCLATSTQEGWMRYLAGDFEGSIASCARIISMDPEFVHARRVQAAALLQLGKTEEAIAQLEYALTIAGSNPVLLAWLAHAKAVTGSRHEALALLARACAVEAPRYVPCFHLALAHTGLGNLDAAFAALDQAWIDRDPALASLGAEPRFEPLRADARYGEIVGRLKLPQLGIRDSGFGIRRPQ
jgi:tetratricopeptide (TPR) repeat protein